MELNYKITGQVLVTKKEGYRYGYTINKYRQITIQVGRYTVGTLSTSTYGRYGTIFWINNNRQVQYNFLDLQQQYGAGRYGTYQQYRYRYNRYLAQQQHQHQHQQQQVSIGMGTVQCRYNGRQVRYLLRYGRYLQNMKCHEFLVFWFFGFRFLFFVIVFCFVGLHI